MQQKKGRSSNLKRYKTQHKYYKTKITQCALNSKFIMHAEIGASPLLSSPLFIVLCHSNWKIVSRPISWNVKWLVYAKLGKSLLLLAYAFYDYFCCATLNLVSKTSMKIGNLKPFLLDWTI